MQLKTAQRKQTKLKLGISSPSGCGRTYSSLLLAKGLVGDWEKVALIDSENGSGAMYDKLGKYQHLDLTPPFSPERYITAIEMCVAAGMEAVIIDSATHEWSGPGGCLEIHQELGGQFNHWARVTPRHNKFLEKILQSPIHVITTARTKTEWSLGTNAKGKSEPTKMGLKAEQRDGLEYEMTVAFRLLPSNLAFVEKDRTSLFTGQPEFKITEETGILLRKWVEGGAAPVSPAPVIVTATAVEELPPDTLKMLSAFSTVGVTREMIEQELGCTVLQLKEKDFTALRQTYDKISKGEPISHHFSGGPKKPASAADLNQRYAGAK